MAFLIHAPQNYLHTHVIPYIRTNAPVRTRAHGTVSCCFGACAVAVATVLDRQDRMAVRVLWTRCTISWAVLRAARQVLGYAALLFYVRAGIAAFAKRGYHNHFSINPPPLSPYPPFLFLSPLVTMLLCMFRTVVGPCNNSALSKSKERVNCSFPGYRSLSGLNVLASQVVKTSEVATLPGGFKPGQTIIAGFSYSLLHIITSLPSFQNTV